jgi:hypothetical protein
MTTPNSSPVATTPGDDKSVHIGRTWEQFKLIQKSFEKTRGVRLAYFDGTIELRQPSLACDLYKKIIAVLLESYLIDREVEFFPTGAAIQEKDGVAAVEPDESYRIGAHQLAIEVNFVSGDEEAKLDRYEALGFDEVWLWADAMLTVYMLSKNGYRKVEASQIPPLAGINIAVMSKCISAGEMSIVTAAKAFRAVHPI